MRWALCLVTLLGVGCEDDDVGRCCELVGEVTGRPDPTPVASFTPEGDPINDIAQDPAFDCQSLTCVVFEPSMEPNADNRAYCTARCDDDADCPEAYECRNVLQSRPSPGAPIQPEDRFCVRSRPDIECFD